MAALVLSLLFAAPGRAQDPLPSWNDGKTKQAMLAFALDRVKALAPQHPEWKEKEPFASLLKGDLKGALADGEPAILQIVMATHAGMTTEEFEKVVKTKFELRDGKPVLRVGL